MAQFLEPYEPGQHDSNEYYIEQLCAIGFGGLMAAIVCKWYVTGEMKYFMSVTLMPVVFAGGLTLLALIVFRGTVVWRVAGEPQPAPVPVHDHGHSHGHSHGHAHGEDRGHEHDHGHSHGIVPAPSRAVASAPAAPHGHSHGHGHGHGSDHDHGWAPWRYMVMLVPIILGFLGMPASGLQPYPRGDTDFGSLQSKRDYSPAQVTRVVAALAAPSYAPLLALAFADPDHVVRSGDYAPITFTQLEEASLTPDQRKFNTGREVQITGQYTGDNERFFSLTRYKINCCGADAIPLKSVIVIDYSQNKGGPRLDPQKMQKKWVQVSGILQFKDRGNGSFIPMIVVTPTRDENEALADLVKEIPQPANPYVN